jgi:dipeptidyl aminopeptidase/acylaminoacyl peptidase
LPAGDYFVQAVLDVNHDYNYRGRSPGDLLSKVVQVHLPSNGAPGLTLVDVVPARQPWLIPARYKSQTTAKHLDEARRATQPLDFVSPALSAFWGRPIHLRGWVVLPPGYDAKSRTTYPVVYFTHGYGGDTIALSTIAATVYGAMAERQMPSMIWVLLDESSATGTH